jgi:SAM-dependent methyltransferase
MHEIRAERIAQFVQWAAMHITGDEKGQAQIFLDRLFQAFGQKGSLDVGGKPEMRIRKAKEDGGGTSFADYVWKPVVLIEVKKRGTDLSRHYKQAFDYWTRLVPNRPHYVILCNFDSFDVYDFDRQIDSPVDSVALTELPQRWGPLAFLFPTNEKPTFGNDREAVTRQAADKLAECFNKLTARKVDPHLAQHFILQMLVALFAEDIDLLPKYLVGNLLEEIKSPPDSYDILGGLFDAMNSPHSPTGGRYKGVRYFNGGLFAEPARIELYDDEVNQLKTTGKSDWSKVSPEIFGTLFQHSMGKEARHAFGAHYTSPVDIMKIVKPTIVDPWTAAIESARSGKRLQDLLERLTTLRVLDPACGSGNFLYLAYREMKRLESRIRERLTIEFPKEQPRLIHVNARQFFGLDINEFAIELAKVTMMIARKLAVDELQIIDEATLPLDNLDANFKAVDALITKTGDGYIQTPWPKADVIIGNPPFLGAKRLKPEHGATYVNAVRKLYPEVPGMADYCVYWIRRAHDHLPACTTDDSFAGRAGLVGTQNIRNNQSRVGGLDRVAVAGTIVEAVDNQPWSGEANVHVSITNWVKTQDKGLLPKKRKLWSPLKQRPRDRRRRGQGPAGKSYELAERQVPHINSALSGEIDVSGKIALLCNKKPKRCFQGKIPGYEGFMLDAKKLTGVGGVSEIVVPYLTGRELLGQFEIDRWAIDFRDRDMLEASQFARPFEHCRKYVLPDVEASLAKEKESNGDGAGARKEHLERWWQFWNRRDELNLTLNCLSRYIGCSRVTRRPVMVFLSTQICPSDLIQVFAFDDDYSFGILQASLHFEWFRKSSRLKVESDTRYSVREVFDTFPWPQSPTVAQINAVAEAGRNIRRVRVEALGKITGGLRAVYRTLEWPGKNPLKDAHADLDAAVLAAYGFSAKDDLLSQLLALNLAVAARETAKEPVISPGIPGHYPDPAALVSGDCIRP